MSDDRPKQSPAPEGPPKLERVPAGYKPSPAVRSVAKAQGVPAAAAPPAKGAPPPPAAPGASRGLAAREVGPAAAIAAGIAHQGKLASDGPLRVFALAAALQATGRLTLSHDGKVYALSFRRGAVEHAGSSDPADGLGRFLVARGSLTEAQRAKAEAAAAGGDLAAALVAEKLVNPAEVAGLLQAHGAGVVQRALAATGGEWAWAPGEPPPPGAFPLGAPFAMLCAAVRALDAPAVLARLGERENRAAARIGGRIQLEQLRLTPQEARAAGLFDGVRSPAQLAAATPGDAVTVLRVALLLGEVELLAFGAVTKAAPPPAAPAPSAASGKAPAPAPPPAGPPAAVKPAPAPAGPQAGPPAAKPATPPAAPQATRPAPAAGAKAAAPAVPPGARTAPPAAPKPAAAPRAASAAAPPRPAAQPPKPAPAPLDEAALDALSKKLAKADHFEVLGVPRTAQAAQIKMAYFQLAKTYHPDTVPADATPAVRKLCADVFARIGEAWSVLGPDASRAEYLEALATGGTASVDVMNIFQAEKTFEEGTLLTKARRYAEAIQKFDEAVKLNADEPEFGIWKAFCEFLNAADKRARHAPSAAAIEAGLKKNPRCAQAYVFLGQMAKVVGDLALAEKQLRRGLAVAPDHADLQRELKYLRK